ncbi:MAG: phosphate regulon transcriptional regulatory protein PhoB [Betaproteobacteria bacterium HGW-Betaproteobacteria-7]|jgi:two-component system phosphate regulon response regulator PhoB|nr:MAG: phosphate regulon transcriptional regulatory protein PhoB [Betaproteobacteria bacterium HGW-Betaproteobacteria-7]
MSARILLVEDEPDVSELILVNLRHAGFVVNAVDDAEKAWKLLREERPEAVLLDWLLPGMSGFQLIRHMRADQRCREVPVIMLTARSAEVDKIAALEAGADDYVTKPFSPRELVARVKAVLRRRDAKSIEEGVELGGLRLMPHTRKALAGKTPIVLGPTEFRLLHFLMTHAERVHSRGQLLDYVWGGRLHIEERTVDVHIRRLRCVLEDHQLDAMVQTVRGIGYRFSTGPTDA